MCSRRLKAWAAEQREDVENGKSVLEWRVGGPVDEALQNIGANKYRVYSQAIVRLERSNSERRPDFCVMKPVLIPRKNHAAVKDEQTLATVEIKQYTISPEALEKAKRKALEQAFRQVYYVTGSTFTVGRRVGYIVVVGDIITFGIVAVPTDDLEVRRKQQEDTLPEDNLVEDDYTGTLQPYVVRSVPWQPFYRDPCFMDLRAMLDEVASTF